MVEQVHDARVAAMATQLRGVLAEIDAGRLTAGPVERARIEGAVVACDVLTGAAVDDIVNRLRHPD